MAEYSDRTGYDPPTGTGTDPADTIKSDQIRNLEKDLWTAWWGPGKALANIDSGTPAEKCEGWDQSPSHGGLSMGTVSGNPASYSDATGVTASDPANVNPASPVDFARGDAHDPLASTATRDHIRALQVRINETIKKTGLSTNGSHANLAYLPEVTEHGALRGSDATTPTALSGDLSRIRDDHSDNISAEIEYMRGASQPPFRWNYGNHHSSGNGTWQLHSANSQLGGAARVYSWNPSASCYFDWGEYSWTASGTDSGTPWSDSGTYDKKNNLPFGEMLYKFTSWNHLRYFFNQAGRIGTKFIYNPGGTPSTNSGSYTWNIAANSGTFWFGIATPTEEPGNIDTTWLPSNCTMLYNSVHNIGGWNVTETANRIYDIPEQANYCQQGTYTTITEIEVSGVYKHVVTKIGNWTNVSPGDIITIPGTTRDYEAEVESVSTTDLTTKRRFRQASLLTDTTRGNVAIELDDLTNNAPTSTDWAVSKYYRAAAMRIDESLYGGGWYGGTGQTGGGDPQVGSDGYIMFDWRIVHWGNTDGTGNHDVVLRVHLDNTPNEMVMVSDLIECNFRARPPTDQTYFNGLEKPNGHQSWATNETDERHRMKA